jgi:hypothetical protein
VSDDAERIGLDTDELPLAKVAFQYVADKRILGRIARLQRRSSRMVQEQNLSLRGKEPATHLEPSDWRTGFLAVHDYDLPFELFEALKECTPQALLRDLYRPDPPAMMYQEREEMVRIDRGGAEAMKEARAAQKRDPIQFVEPLRKELEQHAQAWRKILSTRWKPLLDDSAPRKPVYGLIHDPTLL